MKNIIAGNTAFLLLVVPWATGGSAEQPPRSEDGKYFDAEGDPTYHIAADGTVDWYTYSGFRRYHSGMPRLSRTGWPRQLIRARPGRADEDDVLWGFPRSRRQWARDRDDCDAAQDAGLRHNKNVMCFIDDLYVYLKARADGALGRDRPPKQEPKSDAARAAEKACFGA